MYVDIITLAELGMIGICTGIQTLCLWKLRLFGRQHAPMRQIAMVRPAFGVGLVVILWPRVENHGMPLVTL